MRLFSLLWMILDDMMFLELDRSSVSYLHPFPFKRLQLIKSLGVPHLVEIFNIISLCL